MFLVSYVFLSLQLGSQSETPIEKISELAQKVQVKQLASLSTGDGSEFRALRGGAYDVGRLGWKALELNPVFGGKFVVITTPLTSQDIGELLFERVGSKLRFIDEAKPDGLRLKHHRLAVNFDVDKKFASFVDDVEAVVSDEGSKFHTMRFSPCYRVNSIAQSGKPVPFTQSGGVVMIPKQQPGKLALTVSYSGTVDLPNYAGAITSKSISLTNDYWYPMCNRYPTTYEIWVAPPSSEWSVIGQGNPILPAPAGKSGVGFKMDLPAVYWSLTVLKTKHYAEKFDGRTLQIWSPRMREEQMKLQPALYAPIIRLFDKSFSAFPFNSYGALDSPTYGGGALEAYSYATYGGGLPDEDAHEPSHTWWGGILPNTYLNSFWNESFAVWSEGFYAREVPIGSTLDRREAFAQIAPSEPDYNAAPLMKSGVSIGAAAGSLGYGKGAKVLGMLEQMIGTRNMLDAVQEWIRIHPKAEPAEWEEFEAVVLRRNAGKKLKSFFDDWFRRPGFANVNLVSAKMSGTMLSGKLVWSTPSFRMPLEIWMENSGGARQMVLLDTQECNSQGEFSISTQGFKPKKVYLDPYHKALRAAETASQHAFSTEGMTMKVYRDDSGYMSMLPKGKGQLPDDLNGVLLIGHPDKTPAMKSLCSKAGFTVNGQNLVYQGMAIDLNQCGAVATVSLGNGKWCSIALGKPSMAPRTGRAGVALVDNLGRFLRGECRFPEAIGVPVQ